MARRTFRTDSAGVPGGVRTAALTAALTAARTTVRAAGAALADVFADSSRRPAMGVFLGAAAGTELAAGLRLPLLERVAKPLLVPSLAAYVLRQAGSWHPVDRGLFLAMAAGHAAGDVVLLGDGEALDSVPLTPGALAFGAGHVAGLALYTRSGASFSPRMTALAVATGATVGGVLAAKDGGPTVHHAVQGAYAAVLLEFVLRGAATLRDPRWHRDSGALLAVGAGLWVLSDALIAVRLDAPRGSVAKRMLGVAVMDTYAGGQLLTYTGIARELDRRAGGRRR